MVRAETVGARHYGVRGDAAGEYADGGLQKRQQGHVSGSCQRVRPTDAAHSHAVVNKVAGGAEPVDQGYAA